MARAGPRIEHTRVSPEGGPPRAVQRKRQRLSTQF